MIATFLLASAIALNPRSIEPDTSSNMTRPHVAAASNGRTFIVTWEDLFVPGFPNNGKLYYRTYNADGVPDQQSPMLAVNNAFTPAVVWNGLEWVIAGSVTFNIGMNLDLPIIRAARVQEHGGAIGNEVVVLSGQTPPSLDTGLASNGSGLLIGNGGAVMTARDLSSPKLFKFRVRPLAAAGGTFLTLDETNHLSVVTASGVVLSSYRVDPRGSVAATVNGPEYAVVITGAGGIVDSLTFATDGTITSHQTLQSNADSSEPAVTFSGSGYLAAWALPNELCTAHFTATSIGAAQCGVRQSTPNSISLAAGATNTLLAWSERISGTRTDAVFTRFLSEATGNAIRADDVATGVAGTQTFPRIERTAAGLIVRWTEPSSAARLAYAILSPHGAVTSYGPIAQAATSVPVKIAHARGGTLGVWSDSSAVWAQFIQDEGGYDAPFMLGQGTEPDVASDGTDWLVVWQTTDPRPQITSTIVTNDRTVVSPGGLVLARSTSAQTFPAVASRGTDYLVAWDELNATSELTALGVSPSGNPNGGVMHLAGTRGGIEEIQIAVSGRQYLVVAQNDAGDIGFPVTSIVQDILVAGVDAFQPWRVRGSDSGFALLEGSGPIRTRFIDTLGNDRIGQPLPLIVNTYDFLYDGTSLILAYEQSDGYLSSKVFVDTIAPRRRAR